MPKPRNPTTPRYTPFDFFGYSTSQIILTQTGGTGHLGISTFGEGWNADFTEYTYVCKVIDALTWTGTIKLSNSINTDLLKALFPDLGINSITIGANNPVSLSISN